MKKKRWKGDPRCTLCGAPKTIDRIFFNCRLARFTWASIREILEWERAPNGIQDFMDNWARRGVNNISLVLYCFSIVLWGLWTTRNKYAIEGVFPTKPGDILFKINTLMQK